MVKVCAVLVTYNRKKCLSRLLEALENQSYSLSGIFIFNNNSKDGTKDYLTSKGYKQYLKGQEQNEKIVFNSSENLGGSGGFANAIKIASQLDYDYLWIMDDDVLPELNCLELLIKELVNYNVKVAIPSRNDRYYKDRICKSFDFKSVLKYCPYSRKNVIQYPLTQDVYYVADMPFEGPLIDIELVRKVGIPNEGFFLEYDDSDYAQRLQNYSKIIYVTHAVLHRQLAKRQININSNKKDLYNWRTYYVLRNNIIFDRKYGQNVWVRIISPRLLLIHKLLKSILDGYSKNNIPILFKAYHDGMHKKMGKRVDPNY
jgi:GT2 family glycosyltransferase